MKKIICNKVVAEGRKELRICTCIIVCVGCVKYETFTKLGGPSPSSHFYYYAIHIMISTTNNLLFNRLQSMHLLHNVNIHYRLKVLPKHNNFDKMFAY